MQNLLEEARLADELGLTSSPIGEHHRPDYLVSLAGDGAGRDRRASRSRSGSRAPSPCSRPTTRFASSSSSRTSTSSPAAGPRSWPGAARSSSRSRCSATTSTTTTSSSPRSSSCCSRSATTSASPGQGKHRAPLEDAVVWPRPVQDQLPDLGRRRRHARVGRAGRAARAAAGTRDHRRPDRALHAVRRSLPATPGARPATTGEPRWRSTPTRSSPTRGRQADAPSPRAYLAVMNRIGRERGWPPSGRRSTTRCARRPGRSPSARRRRWPRRSSASTSSSEPERYLAHISIGAVEHKDVMHAIELFGTRVAPLVRAATPAVPALPAG